MLPNERFRFRLYHDQNINARNTIYQKRNIDIFRICRNIVSFPMRYISHEKHKYAPMYIPRCIQLARYGFLLIARRSLLSLLRRQWKEALARLEYFWIWSLIFFLFFLFFPHLSFVRILSFALLLSLTYTCTRILCMLHIFAYVFPFIPFFSPSHGCCVLYMLSLIYSLSLFVSLFPYLPLFSFSFLVSGQALFYADRYFFYLFLFLPCCCGFFDDDILPRISIIEFSTVRRLLSLMLFVAVAFACDPWPRTRLGLEITGIAWLEINFRKI